MEFGMVRKEEVSSFAKGINVLVVDHDKHSLQSIASMLQNYSYKVTTTEEADAALTMIWEEKDEPFNLVMANASGSDISTLSFLRQTGIPIILMLPEMDMKMAGKAIAEWGCHFLEKPISMEDIELVWQHVYRRSRNPSAKELFWKENREESANGGKKSQLGGMIGQVVNVASGAEWNVIEKEMKEKDGENFGEREGRLKASAALFDHLETTKINEEEKKKNRNECTIKRSRIVWSSKLHRKFTEALSKLGNKKSSPKIILKMMNEPTLTLRQVASHLQKFKSQVKHLNKATASDATTSLSRIQLQQLPAKRNSITNTLGQPSYNSDITDNLRQLQVLSCFNGPKFPFQNAVNCHFRMMNQNNSYSCRTTQPNDLQPETYGGFEGMNLVEEDRIFADELYMNESSEDFVQTSQSNLQYLSADVDCTFLSADNQYPDAVQELEFAHNLAGCLDPQNQKHHIMDVGNFSSGAHPAAVDSLNQNVALKELDDLMNNTEEDPMAYCCFDGELNSFDIDQYYEWLKA